MNETETASVIEVAAALRFDEIALETYLAGHLPGFSGALEVKQFNAGQSNPTYRLSTGSNRYVLRKKPPGQLLPSAHAVDREYRVMSALQDSAVPVPRVLHLCLDRDIIGTEFYLMEMVEGRVFHDPSLPDLSPEARRQFYDGYIRSLAALHAIDPAKIGLQDFGRPKGFITRQITRWSKQYQATQTEPIEAMDKLIDWLPANIPDDDQAAIVHGDFRPGNVIAGGEDTNIKAILDWELCALGHPLADLGYCLANYYTDTLATGTFRGLDHTALGIPTEKEFVDLYCQHSGRSALDEYLFYVVFSLFRGAAIIQGVYKRGLDGNASSSEAVRFGHFARSRAETAWRIVAENL
ncbi:MAG: phosphotransferase family protein [Paracoccaceae bacterium]